MGVYFALGPLEAGKRARSKRKTTMMLYPMDSGSVNKPSTTHPTDDPEWVVFATGDSVVRVPFADRDMAADCGWQYLLDITWIGFRVDRVGDTIFVTGRPLGFEGGIS